MHSFTRLFFCALVLLFVLDDDFIPLTECTVTIPTATDPAYASLPFAPGAIGEVARIYMNWTRANELDAIMMPNPIVQVFSSFVYDPSGFKYYFSFYDNEIGMVSTPGVVNVRYHQLPTSAQVNMVAIENFEVICDRAHGWKSHPYRPSGLKHSDLHPSTIDFVEANFGPTFRKSSWNPSCWFNSNCNAGCDWIAHTYYLATRGDGGIMETRVVPIEGKTDYDVYDWIMDPANQGGPIRWIVKVDLMGAALGLAEDIMVTNVTFHERGLTHWEIGRINPELLAILSGMVQKRSIGNVDVPKVLAALADVITAPDAYKARFPEYTPAIDWAVAEAAERQIDGGAKKRTVFSQ